MEKEIGKPWKNIEYYREQMSKSMEDKLFFVNKLNPQKSYLFVDFGCADGSLIKELCNIFEDKASYIGYDCSKTMIDFAKTSYSGDCDVLFTSDWSEVSSCIAKEKDSGKTVVVILSSVIHEVYSYGTKNDINIFWGRILVSGFDMVVVRDMMCDVEVERQADKMAVNLVRALSPTKYLEDFEKTWGNIGENKNLVHYLLKYRWKINWEREVKENYLPLYINDFLDLFGGYRLGYFEKFNVGFLQECVRKDFGIEFPDTTHIKAIFYRIYDDDGE